MDQGGQRRDQVDATVVPNVRRRCGAAPASCTRLQPRQFLADAGDVEADQGLVTDKLEGQADQDRRESREPRPLCYLPDGRGRHRTANVPRILRLIAELRPQPPPAPGEAFDGYAFKSNRQKECVPNARENHQINPSATVRAARCAGSPVWLPKKLENRYYSRQFGSHLGNVGFYSIIRGL